MTDAQTAEEIFDAWVAEPAVTSHEAEIEIDATDEAPGVLERVLAMIGALCLTFFCMEMGGAQTDFLLQAMPYALVLSIVVGGLLASHGPHQLLRMAQVSFGDKVHTDAQAEALRGLCRRGRRLGYVAALLQLIASTVFFLCNLEEMRLGIAVSEVLAAVVFAILLGELCFGAAEHWVKKHEPVSYL